SGGRVIHSPQPIIAPKLCLPHALHTDSITLFRRVTTTPPAPTLDPGGAGQVVSDIGQTWEVGT
ncbi:MAG: hypothetical protein M3014_00425, partial [Chloroflexota bacterium]|nr:hypothetical protein [Chloroflexota bacterium]